MSTMMRTSNDEESTWTCCHCTLVNTVLLPYCATCLKPKKEAQSQHVDDETDSEEKMAPIDHDNSNAYDTWICPKCTLENTNLLPYCSTCCTLKPNPQPIRNNNNNNNDNNNYKIENNQSKLWTTKPIPTMKSNNNYNNNYCNNYCNNLDFAKKMQEKYDNDYKNEIDSYSKASEMNESFKKEAIQIIKDSQLAKEMQKQFTQGAAWFCNHCMLLNLDINSYQCQYCQIKRAKPEMPTILTKNDEIAMQLIRKFNENFNNNNNNGDNNISIINLELTRKFLEKYEKMDDGKNNNNRNEIKICYHWTPSQNHDSIIKTNLVVPDGSKVKHITDTGYFGKGIYMSPNAKYAQAYARNTTNKVFVCLSMPGKVFPAQYPRDLGISLKNGYDSHSAPQRQNMEWVFFDSSQLLPCFLIDINNVDNVVKLLNDEYIPWINEQMKNKNVRNDNQSSFNKKGKSNENNQSMMNELIQMQQRFDQLKSQYNDLTIEDLFDKNQ